MKPETKKRIRTIYGIVLSVVIVISSLLLMAACLQIYLSGGEQTYTPEKVAAAFRPIAVPVYVCLGMVLGSFVLLVIFPKSSQEAPLRNHPDMTLRRMQKRRDLSAGSEEIQAAVRKQRKLRKMLYGICAAVCGVCATVFLIYALNSAHFHQTQINASMVQAMWVLLPCIGVAGAVGLFVSYRSRTSMAEESQLLKQCPKRTAEAEVKPKACRICTIVKSVFVVAAVVLLIYGFVTGGTADVLTKAKNICTECVGLG